MIARRELVERILLGNHVPVVPQGVLRSGVAVSWDGRQISCCMSAADGGADRPAVYAAWFALAVEILRAGDIRVRVSPGGLSAVLEAPEMDAFTWAMTAPRPTRAGAAR